MSSLTPDAVYKIEANGIKGGPDWQAITEDSAWTNSRGTDTIFRMDAGSDKVTATVPIPKPCSGFAVAAGTLWAPSCGDKMIYRIDLITNKIVGKVAVGPANSEGGIAFGAGSAWMPSESDVAKPGVVSRIDPETNKVIASIAVPPGSYTAVYGYNRVWVSSTEKSVVSVIEPTSNKVIAEIPVDANPRFMAAGEGFVWTLNQGKGTVSKIDPLTMKVVATIETGAPGPGGDIATGEGSLWVTQKTIPITRIDPATNKVMAQFVGPGGDAMRIGHGYVWLSNGNEGTVWRFLASKAVVGPPEVLQVGTLPSFWKTSTSNCLTTPDWEIHPYNDDFYILRESGCIDSEKPFLYLIFGEQKALLEDTGSGDVKTAAVVMDLMAKWAKKKNHAPVSLVVIHSHSHGDHTAGDAGFQGMPNVQMIFAKPAEIQKAAGITTWPADKGTIDLGGRIVDVLPIPGHDVASIALYDRLTGNLMTGDSLYPGRLYVPLKEVPTYAASAQRLVDFVKDRPIAHVLGTHIEQSQVPYVDYPRAAPQPEEHTLELTRANVLELNQAFLKMKNNETVLMPETSIVVRVPGVTMSPSIQAGNNMGLEAGVLPGKWMTGGPNCVSVPDWQVHEYNPDFYILRESGCTHFEKPFLYLIFGKEKALLEDTGAGNVQTAPIVTELMAKWAMRNQRTPVPLIVIHSHAHGDHIAGDAQFTSRPDTQFIAASPAEIQKAAAITNWPADIGQIDLGGRVVDIIPIPGHNDASITLYDRRTGNLLTGDSLYPGRLSVGAADLAAFTASAQRLADFVGAHPVAHVLGTHIEQTTTPYVDYPRGTTYQLEEHSLDLPPASVIELNQAFIDMNVSGTLHKIALPDFTVVPRAAPVNPNPVTATLAK